MNLRTTFRVRDASPIPKSGDPKIRNLSFGRDGEAVGVFRAAQSSVGNGEVEDDHGGDWDGEPDALLQKVVRRRRDPDMDSIFLGYLTRNCLLRRCWNLN